VNKKIIKKTKRIKMIQLKKLSTKSQMNHPNKRKVGIKLMKKKPRKMKTRRQKRLERMNELKKFMRNIIKVIMKGSRKKMDFIVRQRSCNSKLTVKTR
jgi:hypothetical protein